MNDQFWHLDHVAADEGARARLAEYVTAARRAHYGTVEKAIRAAEINRATWLRVEAGEGVRDDTLTTVERALGWSQGDAWRIMAGMEPLQPAPSHVSAQGGSGVGALRAHVESAELPEFARAAILAILDSLGSNGGEGEGNQRGA